MRTHSDEHQGHGSRSIVEIRPNTSCLFQPLLAQKRAVLLHGSLLRGRRIGTHTKHCFEAVGSGRNKERPQEQTFPKLRTHVAYFLAPQLIEIGAQQARVL